MRTSVALTAVALCAATALPAQAAADARPQSRLEGQLPSGASYLMDVPADWNGTVLLYSHGYRAVGWPNPAENAPDSATRDKLLDQGYALIGSSYASTGWAVTDAVPDQLATLDLFTERFGAARRTLAWGTSYGGLVTTVLAERHADRFDGSLSMCGLVQGGVANWNSTLDPVFALRTLLGTDVPLTGFADQAEAQSAARTLADDVTAAQRTPEGRARIALAAALHNIPGHNDPAQNKPAPTDWAAQQANQYPAVLGLVQLPAFGWRQEAESRAGGNPSWNTGVDYTAMLHRSPLYKEVTELYKEAGASLRADLKALNRAPRISADPAAVRWMRATGVFNGRLTKPQLNIHTTGDALIPVQAESAYRRAAGAAGSGALLRQAYVDAPGHCTFGPGEMTGALHALEDRLDTGRWNTSPAALNSRAEQADPGGEARYVPYRPTSYPRPHDLAHPGDARP
ncbi:alpha/beta hydrolase family protein [Streptomyces sp. TRM68416]|uniref:alpha/beta hydrolase family protein n=1 Tax=Streptomyces sp. TRM68416 TaxID=2758412 RepID=UPI001CB6EF79|nr:prolyl oligopeptidase family serine peptidase [Streptomyces sp. TRM68416]